MSSFFTVPNSQRKRKRDDRVGAPGSKKRGVDAKTDGGRRTREREESISGSDLDEDAAIDTAESGDESGSDSEDGETAADRRLKLAERYLSNIQEEVDEAGFDAADIDRDLIAERLKKDVDEFKGRTFRQIAAKLSVPTAPHSFFRSDTQSSTAIAVHPPFVYIVSKDKTLTKWELATPSVPGSTESNGDNDTSKRPQRPQRKKPKRVKKHLICCCVAFRKIRGHRGTDNKLIIWDAETLTPSKTFLHHRDSVCSLSFAPYFNNEFRRTIVLRLVRPHNYMVHQREPTLFGHQDHVTGVAAMTIDECVSVGARDRTAACGSNIDCIAPLPPTHFVTGSDSGSLCLWSVHKKKPLYTVRFAHGLDPIPPLNVLSPETDEATAAHNTRHMRPMPRWITALATLPGTDVVLSGSWDGFIRAWRVSEDKKTLIALGPIGVGLPSTVTSLDTPSQQLNQTLALDATPAVEQKEPEPLIKGVINDIAVFERRPESDLPGAESKKSETKHEPRGLSIVAAVGKEHRLARWKCFNNNFHEGPTSGGRNGAVVFEVPFATNDTVKAHV
ncbi:hypothetical protein PDIDSM_4105 [Penicillium digitatum]|nr:hypothetical protein PDIDSM_4105 [Penicillium digitatum]